MVRKIGNEVFEKAIEFEKRIWHTDRIFENDKSLVSHMMNFITEHKEDFMAYMEDQYKRSM